MPTGSLCFGVGREWQKAQKKSDLKETNADFLTNSLEAGSPSEWECAGSSPAVTTLQQEG